MRIAMIGSGYVGLVSGASFADFGHTVTCVDSDGDKIAALKAGRIPIYEPGLEQLIADNVAAGRLGFTTALEPAVAASDIVFIAVGTPSRAGDGHADLSYVHAAAAAIAKGIQGFTVVVTKSTVPIGTGDDVERIIREVNPEADVAVVSNPEFLREGAAIEDFRHPDRVVIGIEDERAREPMAQMYAALEGVPVIFTRRRTAELIKYAANAFLAMKVTFINEMADLCDAVGGDVVEVSRGIGLDRRIGAELLRAGPGYGGSCFPKDTLALVRSAWEVRSPLRLVEATIDANEQRRASMGQRVTTAIGGPVRGKRVAVLGLTFKAGTDDVRESAALAVLRQLLDQGAEVSAYDPQGIPGARALLPEVDYADSAEAAARGAEALVIVTEWDEFRHLDLKALRRIVKRPLLLDFRNLLDRTAVEAAGFEYICIGRPAAAP